MTLRRGTHARRHFWMILVAAGISVPAGSLLLSAPPSSGAVVHRTDVRHKKTPPKVPWAPVVGVYAGPGAVAAAQAFDGQIGGPVPYALDFLDDADWASIADPRWTIQQWQVSQLHMIFGVPMLPSHGASLAQGATGAYDFIFASLASQLVAAGEGDAMLMIGWNPLQSGTAWQVQSAREAAQYVRYWRHIVETMRAVTGAHFRFEWNGGIPDGSLPASAVYPGNHYVSLIATNVFDQLPTATSGSRWFALLALPNGPDWFAQFAQDHHKPLAVAELSLVPASVPGGGGDDAAFVRNVMQWSSTNRVALVVTWDYLSWGIGSGTFPASQAALAKAGKSGGSTTLAVTALDDPPNGT